ncbi:phosphoglycerate dehydrogenase [Phytopseudomonas dryadis]|uniref:Hydroxyacid dehydrogenase n=1 Tax=Phytopseudomonas dryadis TaxID=2487520 RepID=A0A4Q9R829_9GAMM|nr:MULTISPECIES: phosphoglycerate dehydrogenase [Pseudomonas]TBU96754.1 hydroxyacid dehydrogenase [Pseudomonas dryadis]TBV00282.1 hydroxyacid dehydrogenase [Pseudomonas dryadis]TBV12833.1 hydroxyacid dehydrogenase [Pseudomonas sp. FRB 230]
MSEQSPRKVLVTQRFFDAESLAYLQGNGCEVHMADLADGQGDGDLDESQLLALLAGADAWIVGHAWVTAALLEQLPRLKVVARRGVGHERVDVEAVLASGKVVTIAVGGNDASVADHALAMMLALGRRLGESKARMANGDWAISLGRELYGKTVGIIGLGRIGRGVARRVAGFDARVLAYTTCPDWQYGLESGVRHVDLGTLLSESDYVTLHAPLLEDTRFLIDVAALGRMKPTAFLINTARGGLVDDHALLAALLDGGIAGAGLDVFLSETDPHHRATTEALLALPNVVATPHSGASTHEGLQRTNLIAAQCVVAVLNGDTPPAACVIADGRGNFSSEE